MTFDSRPLFVTGGAGFIGSALVRRLIASDIPVVNVDLLTYAGNLESIPDAGIAHRYDFAQVDICDADGIRGLLDRHRPRAIVHLAAESHVDRSIEAPAAFVRTNVAGTANLLTEALRYWAALPNGEAAAFRFLHISTDEVFGSLGASGRFTEQTPYRPNSPYAASKAAADHLVRAWHHTYGLPVLTTNCSNNYGPYQFPEKLIPLVILKAIDRQSLPVYGDGKNVRDWLFVDDHADALLTVLERGTVGQTYNVGGNNERTNVDVVRGICRILDELKPNRGKSHEDLITYVVDRPGHDRRYAIDGTKLEKELGWKPRVSFEDGLRRTVIWYLENERWWERVRSGAYRGERLGLGATV